MNKYTVYGMTGAIALALLADKVAADDHVIDKYVHADQVEPLIKRAYKYGETMGEDNIVNLIAQYCEDTAGFTLVIQGVEVEYTCIRRTGGQDL